MNRSIFGWNNIRTRAVRKKKNKTMLGLCNGHVIADVPRFGVDVVYISIADTRCGGKKIRLASHSSTRHFSFDSEKCVFFLLLLCDCVVIKVNKMKSNVSLWGHRTYIGESVYELLRFEKIFEEPKTYLSSFWWNNNRFKINYAFYLWFYCAYIWELCLLFHLDILKTSK